MSFLRNIDSPERREAAVSLLVEGLGRTASYWRRSFDRSADAVFGHGLLIHKDDEYQGVLLVFSSSREAADGRSRRWLNLSSWYVREAYRNLAVAMLAQVVGERDAVITNLSAKPNVAKILEAFRFQCHSPSLMLAAPLWSNAPGARASVASLGAGELAPFQPRLQEILRDHLQAGWIGGVLSSNVEPAPFLFMPMRKFGLPFAMLAYCADMGLLRQNISSVYRHVLVRGYPLLALPSNELFQDVRGKQVDRFPWYILDRQEDAAPDLLYSEFTYLFKRARS